MIICIFCGKENDGRICSHCIAKKGTKIGNGVKKVGGFLLTVSAIVTSVVAVVATKGKFKPKI